MRIFNGIDFIQRTGVHGGGYLNTYKDGLTGASKKYCVYTKPGTTRYIAGIPHMWVTKDNDVYYTSAFRDNNTDNCDNWVSTNVYKNKTLLKTNAGLIINDLATDDCGNLYFVGTNSNFGVYDEILSVPYIYLGDATGYLAKLTTSNSLSIYPWSRYLFNRLFVKDGTVYVDAFGFYEQDSNYNTYYWSFGKNVFLKFTASAGLQLYTGAVSQNGLSMSGYNYNSSGTLVNPGDFILEGNKFYYSGYPIKTYQLGASQTASYTAYPSETPPSRYFDIKNGYIAMVLSAETNAPKGAVACQLNNTNFNYDIPPMENSAGALIYDVWLQTNLDD